MAIKQHLRLAVAFLALVAASLEARGFAIGDRLPLTGTDGVSFDLEIVAAPPAGIAGQSYVARDGSSGVGAIVNEQNNEIQSLHCQIDSLEKNVESMHETINITNDFISGLETIHNNESVIKDEIYQEVINNEESQNWFNQEIPDGILSILLNNQNSTCAE